MTLISLREIYFISALTAPKPRTSSPLSEEGSSSTGHSANDIGRDGRDSPLSDSSINFDERPRSFASVNLDEVLFVF
jgi:hypothetical protein